jgi:putative heme-binding domain-containing protein
MRCSVLTFATIVTAASALVAQEPAKEALTDIYVPLAIKYTGGEYDDETFDYRLMRPEIAEAGKRYPLIVFLHGAGERGVENKRQLFYLPEQMGQPEFREKFPCYVLAPQCRSEKQWVNVPWGDKKSTPMAKSASHQLQAAIAMIQRTLKHESVDLERVYLTGLSMGGYGSWELAARRPEWFAAVAPICGGGDELQAARLTKLPLWAFHGDADRVVSVGRSRRMIEAIRKAGGKPKYTEFPGVGHNAWNPAYRQKDGVVAWMFQQTRKKSAGKKVAQTKVGRRTPWTTSRLHGTPTPPPPYRIQAAFPGIKFKLPTSLEELPGMNRLMVTEIGGTIYTFPKNKNVKQADPLLELNDDAAIFHATAHPSFVKNRFIFVCYKRGADTFVSRFQLTDSAVPKLDPKSKSIVISWPSGGHNGGCILFGVDGYLYISTGDGSGPNPPDGRTAGQDVSNLFGAVLRIDVNSKSGDRNYAVPADNPFVDLVGARPEIWAYGLRNPWKFGVDSKTGNIFAADNGWESWEMVHQIVRGGNCGWPIMEGRAVLRSEVKRGPTPIRPPVKDHPHREANSVIGGPVYRGRKLPELDGSFIYGDYITGTIWGLKSDGGSYSSSTLVDTDQRITAFAEGSQGELFVLDYDYTGQIYELLPSGLADTSADFPRRLSQTGLFVPGADGSFSPRGQLKPAPGVVGYQVIAKRWMDGAQADRYVAIPGVGTISLSTDASKLASYPEGTVFVKHLSLPSSKRSSRLETQVLHFEHDQWNAYAYLWNEAGTDAELVAADGANLPLQVEGQNGTTIERTWHTSAVNECRLCHNAGSGFVLGFVANQLRVSADYGIISQPRVIGDGDPAKLVDPNDTSQQLNDRARSYLHANCSMCHHPRGNAIVSFYLRRDLPFDQLRTNKGTRIGTFGMRNAKLIVPGDPYRSVLMYRMSKLGYSRMPYIGSQVIDSAGVTLIHDWIRSMPRTPGAEDSTPIRPESAAAKSLDVLATASATQQQRDAAIRKLMESTEGSLAMIMPIHTNRIGSNEKLLIGDVQNATAARGYHSSRSDVRGLFETFIPESKRRATLGPNIKPATILSLRGKADRGKLIFFSDGARCRICHDVNDAAKSTGPTLAAIAGKYPRRSEMLQHVLQPSLKVEDKFATYVIVTTRGQVFTGLLAKQNKDEVTLRVPNDKRLRSFRRNKIEEMFKDKKSLMPERVLMDLTAQEAADLLQYMLSIPPTK